MRKKKKKKFGEPFDKMDSITRMEYCMMMAEGMGFADKEERKRLAGVMYEAMRVFD